MIIFTKAHPATQAISRAAAPADLNEGDIRRNPGEPSAEQAEASSYNKPRVHWRGLTIAIENPAGSVRRGRNRHGVSWEIRMRFDYGEIVGSMGVDGDPVDIYLGPNLEAPMVYVVHQRRVNDWSEYDEDKCMVGFDSEEDAKQAFLSNYTDPRFLGPITAMPVDEFVAKVRATKDKPAMIKALFLKTHVASHVRNGKQVAAYERKPLYASRKVLNGQAVHDWAVSQGFTHVTPPHKMHVTVAYSRAPVHHESIEADAGALMAHPKHVAHLGDDNAVVMHVDNPALHMRHSYMRSMGASWDFETEGYNPHVSISYQNQPIPPSLQPFPDVLHLGPEIVEPLKTGWGRETAKEAGEQKLADDIAAQEQWLQAQAAALGYGGIEEMVEQDYPAFERLAAQWREDHPVEVALKSEPVRTVLFFKGFVGAYLRGGKMVNVRGYRGRDARTNNAPGQLGLFDADEHGEVPPARSAYREPQHTEPTRELIAEHERLVDVLNSPSHADDKAEAKKQAAELAELKREGGGNNGIAAKNAKETPAETVARYRGAAQRMRDLGHHESAKGYEQIADEAQRRADYKAAVTSTKQGPADDNPRRKFYVTIAREGRGVAKLAGPFDTHDEAKAHVDHAREEAYKLDPKSHFDAFGTSGIEADEHKPGVLNERLGIGSKTMTKSIVFVRRLAQAS